jgi:uncharacterized phage protein (TIGR01671 family)
MRELKFRVWDNKNKKFLPESHFAILGSGKVIVTLSGYYEHFTNKTQDDYVVQQYTGLKDKNGKGVYEGDILSHGGKIGTMYYNADRAGFVLEWEYSSHEQNYVNLTCDVAYESVNAGNMFENKELLK